jgi:hypothetical protein
MTDWVDAWARLVAQRVSRRQLLGGMGAITAGSALGVLTPAAASGSVRPPARADKLPSGTRSCPSGYVPCGDICCDPEGTCLTAPNGTHVCSNACAGNAEFQECSGVCQDVLYDPNNCGWCGNVCPPPPPNSKGKSTGAAVCLSGTCGCSCDKGLRECVDAKGRCVCVSGPCACTTANCKSPNTCCNNVCIDTMTDPGNCGGCGKACQCGPGFTAVCTSGTCSCQCLPPHTVCPGPNGSICTNTSYDVANCGTCGNVCASHCGTGAGSTVTCDSGQCAEITITVTFC